MEISDTTYSNSIRPASEQIKTRSDLYATFHRSLTVQKMKVLFFVNHICTREEHGRKKLPHRPRLISDFQRWPWIQPSPSWIDRIRPNLPLDEFATTLLYNFFQKMFVIKKCLKKQFCSSFLFQIN